MLRRIVVALGAMAISSIAWAQDVVTLRPWAELTPAAPVTIADLSTIASSRSATIGAIVVQDRSAAGDAWTSISADEIRRALTRALGTGAGAIDVRGGSCQVRAAQVQAQALVPAVAGSEPSPADVESDGSIRSLIERRLLDDLDVERARLHLEFDERDDSLLNEAVADRTLELTPQGRSERLSIKVRLFRGPTLDREATVRIRVLVQRGVVVPRATIARGSAITADAVREELAWLPMTDTPASPADVIGSVARSRLAAGTPISIGAFERAIVVRKGQLITVHCVSGSFTVTTTARALSEARAGDIIQLRAVSGTGVFSARIESDGRAIATSETQHTGPNTTPIENPRSEPVVEPEAPTVPRTTSATAPPIDRPQDERARRAAYRRLSQMKMKEPEGAPK